VTLLSYSYWIRERGWAGPARIRTVRLDLGAAYALTGLFGVAVIVIAAGVGAERMAGNEMALSLARRVGAVAGPATEAIFLAGFWGAVFTSMLGVWQGVPYLFADALRLLRGESGVPGPESGAYRAYLLFIALPPMLLLLVDRPVWIVLVYSVAGALFMPFLAATLLYLNNRHALMQSLRNRRAANVALAAAMVLFAFLAGSELVERL
ncbi:MAG: Nramp family divalent metal transporter, partial [Rhodothermales bacterium]|nr:Nramp family divalent metal transporter [Rhodothermales bacterium]